MPSVSIGLPVYNGEAFIENALDSILTQTYEDFELIISDNASTDRTQEICDKYIKLDGRVKYYRNEKNIGAALNFNRVFELSKGEYFKWATYDDLCGPQLLESCIKILDQDESIVLCYPKTILINEEGKIINKYDDNLDLQDTSPHKRLQHLVLHLNLSNAIFGLIRSKTLKKTRLIGNYIGADYITLVELCLLGKFYEIQEYHFFRRDHSKNMRNLPYAERANWFNPSNNPLRRYYPETRLVMEQFNAINRANVAFQEKIMCYFQIGRWIFRQFRATGGKYKSIVKRFVYR